MTLDRLKILNVEPDFDVWKEYAKNVGVHASILSFLEVKKEYFYIVESTAEGKNYVTARGWEDLSKMIYIYESKNIKVDEILISEYLHHKDVSKEFAVYYDLYNKYKSDYKIIDIVRGKVDDEIKKRAKDAKFDERVSLLSLLIDNISAGMKSVVDMDSCLLHYIDILKYVKAELTGDFSKIKEEENKNIDEKSDYNIEKEVDLLASGVDVGENNSQLKIRVKKDKNTLEEKYKKLDYMTSLNKHILEEKSKLNRLMISGALTDDEKLKTNFVIKNLMYLLETLKVDGVQNNEFAYEFIRNDYNLKVSKHEENIKIIKESIENVFKFVEEVFGNSKEIVILVAELTTRYNAAKFISTFGSNSYFKYNKEILFYERKQELIKKIEELE